MTYVEHQRGRAIQVLVHLAAYDTGQGVTLRSVAPGFWQVGESGCIPHIDTLDQLAHAGLLNLGDLTALAKGHNTIVTVTQAGRDYLTHHQNRNARKDSHQ